MTFPAPELLSLYEFVVIDENGETRKVDVMSMTSKFEELKGKIIAEFAARGCTVTEHREFGTPGPMADWN